MRFNTICVECGEYKWCGRECARKPRWGFPHPDEIVMKEDDDPEQYVPEHYAIPTHVKTIQVKIIPDPKVVAKEATEKRRREKISKAKKAYWAKRRGE